MSNNVIKEQMVQAAMFQLEELNLLTDSTEDELYSHSIGELAILLMELKRIAVISEITPEEVEGIKFILNSKEQVMFSF